MTKILVIDDQEELREIIIEILISEDFDVIDADGGHSGVKLAQKELPDLIICDVMMPKLDGYGVLTALRQNSSTEAIPFIFLTAKATKDDLRQGMELGADDYLTKPFTAHELLKAISTRLEKQGVIERQSQKKLNELRSNLTHSLPHELHTPLQGIIGCSKFMLDEYHSLEQEEVLEMLEAIHTSGQRLYRLTQNFLLYAELEMMATNSERVKVLRKGEEKSYIQTMITQVALQKAQQANRETDLQLELQEAIVQLPKEKFQKIIEELIDNAFKFSTINTPVRISSSYEENTFNLDVIDRGRGMTASQIANFGAYLQFERKLYEQQGSGLGLVIAKRLVELYGGELTIESIPGQQTTVHIALPCEL